MHRIASFRSLPQYLLGGVIAALVAIIGRRFGWQVAALVVPVVYAAFRLYHYHLGRLESEKCHAEEMAALHLRTIEALALAIEAKDQTTHDHLERVQVYALELGKKLKLNDSQLQALRAAAILHDIGKLAVPEHIISKPGKLTSEEFDKMKIHPIVGAEIVERVQFPYDVAPIVRAHHERWNGTGYPYGLRGEEIPIGARILAVVDCLDALASDRQYRRALPLEEALAAIVAEAGKSYDPRIVEILRENCREWELLTHSQGSPKASRLSREVPTANGDAPAAGFQNAAADDPRRREVLFSIAAARQEAQTLHELTLDLGNTLNLDETLALLDKRLHRLIPYDAIAVYLRQDDRLVPRYVNGEDGSLFSSLRIPVGQGLSGWVADAGKPILNGNPAVEPGYLNDPSKSSHLRSALAVPLENASGIMGVLTLYRLRADGFTNDHLRTMLALKPKVSLIIENALHFHQAATSATVDALTSLPNAHSLLAHLDTQLVSCRRNNSVLAVLVCDLDGLKQVSDRFGQQLGNQALKMVAAGLRTCCRESDFVGRMGGDEFVLVMPGFKKEYLPEKLHALERMAVEAGVAVAGEPVLHISIGAAFCPEDGTARESLLAEAGRRMYLARHGRVDGGAPSMEDLAELAARVQHPSEHAAHSPLLK